jgi:uncharacterized membrane protein
MIDERMRVLIVMTVAGAGLMAGFFFAFSAGVMRALARLAPPQGIAAMQSINVAVINPLFLPVFLGTGVACACLTIVSLLDRQRSGSDLLLAGSLLYLTGTFLVTMICNVPRNNGLAQVDPASAEGARVWGAYLREWTAWNHVRTVTSAAAALALLFAI